MKSEFLTGSKFQPPSHFWAQPQWLRERGGRLFYHSMNIDKLCGFDAFIFKCLDSIVLSQS